MSKGQDTRQRIIASAAPLFNKRGFDGCSMQDIMEATALEKGGIYRHFGSKEELAAECFQYSWAQAVECRSGDVEHISNAVEKLRYLVNKFVSTPSTVPGGCPLMNASIDADDGNSRLRELTEKGLREWKSRLIKIVRDGMQRREIREGTDPQLVANSIVAQLEGSLFISRIEKSPRALNDAKQALNSILESISS